MIGPIEKHTANGIIAWLSYIYIINMLKTEQKHEISCGYVKNKRYW